MQHENYTLTRAYAQAWNQLSAAPISNFLAPDVSYESQFVMTPLEGKREVLRYLKKKFVGLKNHIANGDTKVWAQMAEMGTKKKPLLLLCQDNGNEVIKICVFVRVTNGLISRIDVCQFPMASQVNALEDFPK